MIQANQSTPIRPCLNVQGTENHYFHLETQMHYRFYEQPILSRTKSETNSLKFDHQFIYRV